MNPTGPELSVNRSASAAVEGDKPRSESALGTVLVPVFFLGLLFCLSTTTSCVQVDGGAIELSWTLRSFTGDPIKDPACASAQIDEIRLWWQAEDTGEVRFRAFPCSESRGATAFVVPPGNNSIWVTPVCSGGIEAIAGSFDAPSPIVRQVAEGEVVTFNTVLLVVSDRTEPDSDQCSLAGCTCGP